MQNSKSVFIKKMRFLQNKHILPLSIIIIINVIFFARLFFPEPHLYYTPDSGRSDIWNFNYPLKDFLSQSLKKGELPFWNKNIGTGFPVFAESQVGTLFIPNLILFGLLPTWLAWNLNYPLMFIINAIGIYLFFTQQKFSKSASLLASLAFSLGGFFIVHIPHTNFIQTAALFPWLLLTGQQTWNKPSKHNILLFSFLLSQQICAGYVQYTFISLIGIIILLLFRSIFTKQSKTIEKTLFLIIAITLGVLLSAPQLLPTLQLMKLSRSNTTSNQPFNYPFPPKHLLSLINPTAFGSPQNGTYPTFNEDWGLFWENTSYLGLLPLFLAVLSLIKPKKNSFEKTLLGILILSLLLSFGKYSPLKFLFLFPGFGTFRVPSRFLLLTSFSLAGLSAVGFDFIQNNISKPKPLRSAMKFIPIFIISLTTLDLFIFAYNYHPLVPKTEALAPPHITNVLIPSERISLDQQEQFKQWNKTFLSNGWLNTSPYLYFKNGLDANLNLLYNIPQIDVYAGLVPLRQTLIDVLTSENIRNALSAKKIITLSEIDENKDNLVARIDPPINNLPSYFVYNNPHALERVRFVSQVKTAYNLNEYAKTISDPSFSFETTAILENDIGTKQFQTEGTIEIVEDTHQKLTFHTDSQKTSLLVIADSYYPGWTATINNKKIDLLAANLNQRALVVPAGKNTITLSYTPTWFIMGIGISFLSFFSFLLVKIGKQNK